MKAPLILAIAALAMVCTGAARHPAPRHAGMTKGVANAALAAKARITPVKDVDYTDDRCDDRTVEQWLKAITGRQARAITWTGGPCELVGPGIDSGSDWCAQAVITLAHPKDRHDTPMIEIYFEAPKHGRPGVAYAFRGSMRAADGQDLTRRRSEFEGDWASRFPGNEGVFDCQGE